MRILFASSEIYPYAKSGGLADISAAYIDALSQESFELFSVMPLYGFMKKKTLTKLREFAVDLAGETYKVNLYAKKDKKALIYFIEAPYLSDTEMMYGDAMGDYGNNDLRFALFSAALSVVAIEENIDLVHLNDWHCALAPLYLKEKQSKIKTILTVHNLAYQGVFAKESLSKIGLDTQKYFHSECLEFYGSVNYLKAGIALSDLVTTVSPSYAQEILTPAFGCGLEGFLQHHSAKIRGILNGINLKEFDPKTDKALVSSYDANSLDKKHLNKKELLKEYALKDPRKALFVMVSRLVEQKGVDLLLETLPTMLEEKINVLVVGEGGSHYEQELDKLSKQYDTFAYVQGYDEKLSRRVYAAGDFLLMPSRFEPCGLNQMIAMRYGTLPIVHSVGGLRDSVHEKSSYGCMRGFVFETFEKELFMDAIVRALELRKNKKVFVPLQQEVMECDLSLKQSVLTYKKIYQSLI